MTKGKRYMCGGGRDRGYVTGRALNRCRRCKIHRAGAVLRIYAYFWN